MTIEYRAGAPSDVPNVAGLLEEYMQETYHGPWRGTRLRLAGDGFGARFHLTVAAGDSALIGFAAWRTTYDLHHCLPGIEVIDLYVRPPRRGRGVAACLLARVAAEAAQLGATYMTGGGVDTGSARRLYARATMAHGGQPYLSGRAFRAFARLAGAAPRQLSSHMPQREWNLNP
jgi:GNAT superfamily N-acetyltransferase